MSTLKVLASLFESLIMAKKNFESPNKVFYSLKMAQNISKCRPNSPNLATLFGGNE